MPIFSLAAALKYRAHLVLFFSKAKAVWKNSLNESLFPSLRVALSFINEIGSSSILLLYCGIKIPRSSAIVFSQRLKPSGKTFLFQSFLFHFVELGIASVHSFILFSKTDAGHPSLGFQSLNSGSQPPTFVSSNNRKRI